MDLCVFVTCYYSFEFTLIFVREGRLEGKNNKERLECMKQRLE